MGEKLNFQSYPFEQKPPAGWAISTLGQIADSVRPGFASGQHNKDGEGIPHLRPMNINADGEVDLSDIRYVATDVNSLRISKGDILFNNTNSVIWVGKTAIIRLDGEYAFSNHMTRIKLDNSYMNSEFIASQLHHLSMRGYFQVHCKKHVNQASVSGKELENTVPLLIPPFNEQERIAARIEVLKTRIRRAREALESIPDLLEQLRQSILASAFRGDLTKKWREEHPDVEPASELLKRIRAERRKCWENSELEKLKARGLSGETLDSEFAKRQNNYKEPAPVDTTDLPKLPEGWCWVNIRQLSWNAGYGTSAKCDMEGAGTPVLRIPNILDGKINLRDLKYAVQEIAVFPSDHLSIGDFLIIRTNGSLDLLGRGAVVEDEFDVQTYFASYLIRYRLCGGLTVAKWACSLWMSSTIRAKLTTLAATSAGQYNVSLAKLDSVALPLPPADEMEQAIKTLAGCFARLDSLLNLYNGIERRLASLDQSILSKAFRGELVPQDPTDEPASVLLERIREEKERLATENIPIVKRRAGKMKGTKERHMLGVLLEAEGAMTPEELFAACGFEEDSVDSFYEQLREAVSANLIQETRDGDTVRLEAVK